MEQSEEGIGIKVYTATPPEGSTSISSLPKLPTETGRKRKDVAKGIQKTTSKTSMLANLLPTGTLLTFEMVLPSVYHNGDCSHVNTMMIYFLLCLCALSCFFFHFTDNFRGSDGKVYYGFVTPRDWLCSNLVSMLNLQKTINTRLDSLILFMPSSRSWCLWQLRFRIIEVQTVFSPGHEKEIDQVMESFPLMVRIICSALFLVFPNTRFGIGCMAA